MAKCLVLGANGLIGSYIVDSLVDAGHEVRAFDRFGADKENYKESDNVSQFTGDFLNSNDLKIALEGMDYVFHFISTTTPITAENDPTIDIETNIRMSVELFQLCVEKGIKRIIYPSTGGAIYGLSPTSTGVHSEDDPTLPVSPYAIGKLTIENYLRYFYTKYGLDYITFRISNPYGNRQSHQSKQGVIPIFLDRISNNQPITVYGDGSMIRDYIYVKDVADMIVNAFDKQHKRNTYNIGYGNGASVNEIIDCIEEVTGIKPNIKHETKPVTFIDKVVLDTSRYMSEFHMEPSTSLRDGIDATYKSITKTQPS
ncbi:MAG: NAD-dependent epimerase/dehydratase family protein [Candidatus Nomurabacteria bacterium]|nr:MAG: NAD-dependent epimerase/dehydratase family protein [Candidatus Nomurabacteria bacterium]